MNIECNYASIEFKKDGDHSYYSFLKYLLEKKKSSEDIKMCICRVLILLFGDVENGKPKSIAQEESDKISAQQVVQSLIDCYKYGKRALKEVAIDALFNMGSIKEYIEVMVSHELQESLMENLLTPHHPLLFKSLRCMFKIISEDKNVTTLFKNIETLYERLESTVKSFSKISDFGSQFSIEIKYYIMSILFTLLKKYQPPDSAKEDFIFNTYKDIIIEACDELKNLFSDPFYVRSAGASSQKAELNDEHPNFHVRLTQPEVGYAKVLLSLIIQFCNRDEMMIGMMLFDKMCNFFVEKIFFQVYQACLMDKDDRKCIFIYNKYLFYG